MEEFLWLVISRFGTQGLAVLFTLVLARRLGSAEFGVYAFIAAVIFVGNALTTFGTDMLLIREIASRNDLSQLLPALLIQLALSGGLIAGHRAAAPLLPNQSPASVLGSANLQPGAAAAGLFQRLHHGAARADSAWNVYGVEPGGVGSPGGACGIDPPGGSIALAGRGTVNGAVRRGAVGRDVLCAVQIPGFLAGLAFFLAEGGSGWYAPAAPIALIALISILYQKISIYMISRLRGSGPDRLVFRRAARDRSIQNHSPGRLYRPLPGHGVCVRRVRWTSMAVRDNQVPWKGSFAADLEAVALGIYGSCVVACISLPRRDPDFIWAEYAPAVGGLRILAWIMIPFTINTFSSLSSLAHHEEQVVLRVQSAGLAALIGLNAWWIPRWGINRDLPWPGGGGNSCSQLLLPGPLGTGGGRKTRQSGRSDDR